MNVGLSSYHGFLIISNHNYNNNNYFIPNETYLINIANAAYLTDTHSINLINIFFFKSFHYLLIITNKTSSI